MKLWKRHLGNPPAPDPPNQLEGISQLIRARL
jgi:hypothetical protein